MSDKNLTVSLYMFANDCRPVELKKQVDQLGVELEDTKEKLNHSIECNRQLEERYGCVLFSVVRLRC